MSDSPSTAQPVVWHLGRHGEVAGGMTQVVNAYLAWPFSRSHVKVIASRDGSKGPRAWYLAWRALQRVFLLDRSQPQVLVAHLSQGGSFVREGMLMCLAAWRGVPTIAHLHGSSFAAFARRRPFWVRRVLGHANAVIALSDETSNAVRTLLPHARIERLPNAVPAGRPRDKEQLVVFGGVVSARKGVDILVKAWRAAGAGRGWTLVIAGPHVDPTVVDLSLPDALWLGGVAHSELMEWLDRSAVAVLPSRDEAMPMFILEAMARDNCVIAGAVGGIPAVLSEGRGYLVAPGSLSDLTTVMEEVLTDQRARQAVAAKGREAFDTNFSSAAVYPRIEDLWIQVALGTGYGHRGGR
ncbi:MAG: glycosyltransferase family 4 protein [Burkholderiales bacterium]|nr:glycosyltransferase family 4 protein [Burkholderiales bacterium]